MTNICEEIDRTIEDYESCSNGFLRKRGVWRFEAIFDLQFVTQGIYSRPDKLGGSLFAFLTVQDVAKQLNPPGLWLNIQHDAFFSQQNFSMRSFVLSVFKSAIVNYISSPEVDFLRSILSRKPSTTKLIFRFLGQDEVEPSINQTYGFLLSNLTFIKTFASGILVPKSYIWPVDNLYLQLHTSVVLDAHKEGLEVFASDFANDVPFAYNFSYNPVAEYLSFIDNGNFSVDGVLSDFPITPSAAIACFSHRGRNVSGQEKPLVISSKGSSGDCPGCTDLAYQRAISDGVDVLDCPVQMTKDGIPVCLGSINLIDYTKVAQSSFSNLTTTISELGVVNGIFPFSLTWSQIQSLTPSISNPYIASQLFRNPKFKNAGKFMTLFEFLALANNASSVSGVLISIEDAAFLAANQSLSVTDTVLDVLRNELVYVVDEDIRDADNSTDAEITKFVNSVVVSKSSVFPDRDAYLTGTTDVVQKLHAFKLPVFVKLFRNEFISQAWDFCSDAIVEINSLVMGAEIDGVITEFPGTAAKYINFFSSYENRCLGLGNNTPYYMSPVQAGGLLQLMAAPDLPPAQSPNPILTESDVVEPPLPAVVVKSPTSDIGNVTISPTTTPSNGLPKVVSFIFLSYPASLLATLALF
ncbi:hypothetical protein TEA_010309 [Camellia sinensis var. sinensis]|uniref:glycerophosphodiester phosphodiesterase n=1 Tax=Camellia sinensis var. sinensis TaxID=542762 RepID=A0A4S4DFH3_CAMSN|nr:hypothetical protein TEA_010309 [Camellia sinensis var. sinensis]